MPARTIGHHPIEPSAKRWPNKHEQHFADMARGLGWDITKRGWPDFLCFAKDSTEAIFVEVKPPGFGLRKSQWRVLMLLSKLGAKCFTSDGFTLVPFDPEMPPDWIPDEG